MHYCNIVLQPLMASSWAFSTWVYGSLVISLSVTAIRERHAIISELITEHYICSVCLPLACEDRIKRRRQDAHAYHRNNLGVGRLALCVLHPRRQSLQQQEHPRR